MFSASALASYLLSARLSFSSPTADGVSCVYRLVNPVSAFTGHPFLAGSVPSVLFFGTPVAREPS